MSPPPAVSEAEQSKLFSLLRANQIPSLPSNVSIIQELSTATETAIINHDNEIARLSCLLVSLENQKRNWLEHKRGLESLCAPIRRLSDDCLQHIFRLIDGRCYNSGPPEIACPGLVMSQVCSHWRTIALRSSELWADVYVSLYQTCPDQMQVMADAVRHILALSGERPLSIHFEPFSTAIYDDAWYEGVCPVIPVLTATSWRWRRLVLVHESFMVTDFQDALLECDLSRLQYLEYLREEAEPNDVDQLTIMGSVLNHSPRLTSLKLSQTIFGNDEPIAMNTMLTSLELQHFLPEKLDNLVKYFPALTSLKLTVMFYKKTEQPQPPFLMASLTSLEVTTDNTGYPFLDRLTLPCLSTLLVRIENADHIIRAVPDAINLGDFFRFLKRSACPISSLSFNEMPLSSQYLLRLLNLLPELESLEIVQTKTLSRPSGMNRDSDNPSIVADASLFLALDQATVPTLAPKLKTLSLALPIVPERDLVQAVQSRWTRLEGRCDCLQSLTVKVTKQLDARKIAPLKYLKAGGMRVLLMDETGILIS